ncbi:MAG: 4'-phosphopantetheinyl transferase superfamily protein [Deltaproteobacteria bacterium]|nr:4'-phosphopantetheinyl transferase superfamily protein [Deltaproteobacteria bacterium]
MSIEFTAVSKAPLSIGDDIVDLSLANDLHPRFANRVFTDSEREAIRDSWSLLWLHWAAKEAAYKAFKRINTALVFLPKRFQFDIDTATVSTPTGTGHCRWSVNGDFVHVGCTTGRCSDLMQLRSWTAQIVEDKERVQAKEHSMCARQLAILKVAQALDLSEQDLRISNNRKGAWSSIPFLEVKGRPLEYPISLSHDGRFVSCSLRL